MKTRKLAYVGHIVRGKKDAPYFTVNITKHNIGQEISVAWERTLRLGNLMEWYDCSSVELFRADYPSE